MDEQLRKLLRGIVEYDGLINDMLKGRTIEIVSNFNDQPIGRSEPSLKGKRYKIKGANSDPRGDGEIHLWCDGLWCFPQLWLDAVLVSETSSDSAGAKHE